jgi:hypothetical protein
MRATLTSLADILFTPPILEYRTGAGKQLLRTGRLESPVEIKRFATL